LRVGCLCVLFFPSLRGAASLGARTKPKQQQQQRHSTRRAAEDEGQEQGTQGNNNTEASKERGMF
jgi:hypothetical protein